MKRKSHNTKKLRTFFLFLLVATVIWVLSKFSKDFTATVTASLKYHSLPSSSVLAEVNTDQLAFDITANGFDFLRYQLKRPEISIPVNDYYEDGNRTVSISNEELSKLISTELGKSISAQDVAISELIINLDVVETRMVAVRASTNITFKDGFRQVSDHEIEPDSVSVQGAKNILDSLAYLSTEPIVASNLDNDFEASAQIAKPKGKKITVTPESVQFKIDVTEFTQKKLVIPIELINVPSNTSVKIIPETLSLTFEVSIDSFNSISATDFKAVCDFDKRNSEENFMLVELNKQPEGIYNLEFGEKKIDYLIFK